MLQMWLAATKRRTLSGISVVPIGGKRSSGTRYICIPKPESEQLVMETRSHGIFEGACLNLAWILAWACEACLDLAWACLHGASQPTEIIRYDYTVLEYPRVNLVFTPTSIQAIRRNGNLVRVPIHKPYAPNPYVATQSAYFLRQTCLSSHHGACKFATNGGSRSFVGVSAWIPVQRDVFVVSILCFQCLVLQTVVAHELLASSTHWICTANDPYSPFGMIVPMGKGDTASPTESLFNDRIATP